MIKPVCPHCEVTLERRVNLGVFQYFCPSCLGFSVAFGGLKKILDSTQVSRLWREAETAVESSVCCSHCRKPMRQIFAGYGHSNIELDVCRLCFLVWLDTGEWSDLEKLPKDRSGSQSTVEYAKLLLELEKTKKEPLISKIGEPESSLTASQTVLTFLGLPVEEKSDFFKVEPWITWCLIMLCTAISLWVLKQGHSAILSLGYMKDMRFPKNLLFGTVSFFVHGGLMHMLGNLYFLWVFGDNVEDHLGKSKYLSLIFLATFMGHCFYGVFDPHSATVPSVGASGGISGVMAYYLIRFPSRRFIFRYFLVRLVAIPGYMFGILFLFKELIGAMVQAHGYSSVSHLAHLGGAFVGVIYAIYFAPRIKE